MPRQLPERVESYVVNTRERFVKEELEPLRKRLGVPIDKMGPMIGLSKSHYSKITSTWRYGPLEILMLYRDALRDMSAAGGRKQEGRNELGSMCGMLAEKRANRESKS